MIDASRADDSRDRELFEEDEGVGYGALLDRESDEHFMRIALRQAAEAFEKDEVPVGAVIVRRGTVIGAAHNGRETLKDPTAHAEMLAITQAAAAVDDWRLNGCTLYVTLEPCPMCAGALVLARVDRVVFGTWDPKGGAVGSLYRIGEDERLNHRFQVTSGVMQPDCAEILTEFFRRKRAAGKK